MAFPAAAQIELPPYIRRLRSTGPALKSTREGLRGPPPRTAAAPAPGSLSEDPNTRSQHAAQPHETDTTRNAADAEAAAGRSLAAAGCGPNLTKADSGHGARTAASGLAGTAPAPETAGAGVKALPEGHEVVRAGAMEAGPIDVDDGGAVDDDVGGVVLWTEAEGAGEAGWELRQLQQQQRQQQPARSLVPHGGSGQPQGGTAAVAMARAAARSITAGLQHGQRQGQQRTAADGHDVDMVIVEDEEDVWGHVEALVGAGSPGQQLGGDRQLRDEGQEGGQQEVVVVGSQAGSYTRGETHGATHAAIGHDDLEAAEEAELMAKQTAETQQLRPDGSRATSASGVPGASPGEGRPGPLEDVGGNRGGADGGAAGGVAAAVALAEQQVEQQRRAAVPVLAKRRAKYRLIEEEGEEEGGEGQPGPGDRQQAEAGMEDGAGGGGYLRDGHQTYAVQLR